MKGKIRIIKHANVPAPAQGDLFIPMDLGLASPVSGRETILPANLTSGTVIQLPSGMKCSIINTKKTNIYDERLYRVRFHPHNQDGWNMPDIIGSSFYTRDELSKQGAELITKGELT